jgi:hypothetical protein
VVAALPFAWRYAAARYRVHAASNPQQATIQQHYEVTNHRLKAVALDNGL